MDDGRSCDVQFGNHENPLLEDISTSVVDFARNPEPRLSARNSGESHYNNGNQRFLKCTLVISMMANENDE